ncbi:bifunctional diguanylate cyclase/phosphodiesterase [Bacillus salacetis]|uniref:bifunctional diguanylate cyclase/phosphodiesterase n=1 Tax=Bacillus salacetis TaxID=2315464 RepID=UPI001443FFD0|nr:EAL domain-containing protein [Bacillus salacetis]
MPDTETIYLLEGEYSLWIVLLSVVIACCASFTALSMNQRMQQTSFFSRNFWLILASVAMGLGIWSMHFIGMSAFMIPVSMSYNIPMTVLSIVPAVFASYLAFYFANKRSVAHWSNLIAGIIMGLGISAMHYIGMDAMIMDADYVYRPWIFLASIGIAIVVSYVALFIFSRLQKYMGNLLIKIGTSVVMGLAITSMHYTGMAAVMFYSYVPVSSHSHNMHMDMPLLIISITTGIAILLLLSGLTSLLDRYVDYRLNYFDSLTRFPNQRQFEKDQLTIGEVKSLAVLHIHNMEKWTNAQGYVFGDSIIEAIRDLIQLHLPADTKVYRIEGNRFAILFLGEKKIDKSKEVLEKLMSAMKRPMKAGNHHVLIDMVCAVSHSDESQEARELFSQGMAVLQHPDLAYNHALVEYDPVIHTYSLERQLIRDIDKGLKENELFVVYQPKIHPVTREIEGMEALLRWGHPEHGMISPGVFIPILEANGKIFDVTDWVIEKVCRQIFQWQQVGMPLHQVSINIPGPYVTSPSLLGVLNYTISKYKIDSRLIELEVTETSVINDIENAIIAVRNFRDLGFSVALDDFGTGLSSLSYLRQLPIATIKIDKSFVAGVPENEKNSSVLRAIITLCDSLNLKVVIEGIETREQVEFVNSMSENPLIQGYYFSQPRTAHDIMIWMKEREVLVH